MRDVCEDTGRLPTAIIGESQAGGQYHSAMIAKAVLVEGCMCLPYSLARQGSSLLDCNDAYAAPGICCMPALCSAA